MSRFIVLMILVFGAAGARAQAVCGAVDRAAFVRMQGAPAERLAFDSPAPMTPFNNPFTVSLPLDDDPLPAVVEAYALRTSQADAAPVPLSVTSVGSADSRMHVTLRLDSARAAADDGPGIARWGERFGLVIIGCPDPGADSDTPGRVTVFGATERQFTTLRSGLVWAGFAVIVVGLFLLVLMLAYRKDAGGPWRGVKLAFAGLHNKLSLTKVQLFIFSVTVLIALAYAYGRTDSLSDLSTDVLLLLGISATSATVATLSDRFKSRLDWNNWVWLAKKWQVIKPAKDAELGWFDLVSSNGEFDVSRFQALVFTLLVAPAFLFTSVYAIAHATIPQGILAVLGLSQVTYIAGKWVAAPTLQEFNTQLTAYREKEEKGEARSPAEAKALMSAFEGAFEYDWPEAKSLVDASDAVRDAP